ncbi:type IV secretion system protein VirD4 [Asticcacaulis excentricus]|uniref:Type IV secretion system protein VirD4 n=1 Tax=Asticcacaulis excentricus TaxID=78587 RepID=A0A3G9G7K9_9CAUL|nr:type IV secretion system protein VirD4 [Asticcacaulis excentricus]
MAASVWRARQSRRVTTYGSARWASLKEISRAGLLRERGVFLGRVGPEYLRHEGPEHVLAFAPTRSGKGVGLVVPTLLSWTGSVIVHDIKGENWDLTAGWRSRFSHAVLFNPTNLRSARYNPLLEVRKGINEVRDVQSIADILVDPEGALERRSHWEKNSHSLLVGAILHVLYAEPEKTLACVARFLSDPDRSLVDAMNCMLATNHLGGEGEPPRVHPVVASAARDILNKAPNERSGVLSTAMSFLSLYQDPVVAATTSTCDWRIADLVNAESPMSLYLVIPPSDISRTKPLVRLMLNQIGRRLTERLEGDLAKRSRHQLLMMLDEFPALGRLDFFETALAFQAGYGIRAYPGDPSLRETQVPAQEWRSGNAGGGGVSAPATVSEVFFQIAPRLSTVAEKAPPSDIRPLDVVMSPVPVGPTEGVSLAKPDFVDRKGYGGIYNGHQMQTPVSPYQVMAGTVISASLVTGLKSDLPGSSSPRSRSLSLTRFRPDTC